MSESDVLSWSIADFLLENVKAAKSKREAQRRIEYFMSICEFKLGLKKQFSTLLNDQQLDSFDAILDEFCGDQQNE